MVISQPFSGKLGWIADINWPQKKKFYIEVRWRLQRVILWLILSTNGWLIHNPNNKFLVFFPLTRLIFYAWLNYEMRTDKISDSWGVKWNWYLCYSNSQIHRSKGICYSRFAITILPHLLECFSHDTNPLSSHVFDNFFHQEMKKN